jgi:import inner membrane translocase subunit TIM10
MAQQAEMDKLKFVQDLEVEMMSDMYNRLMMVCHEKCISSKYTEADISKGEAVCLDRCVAKFLDIHDRVGRKLTQLTVQDEEMMKRMQAQGGA